MDGSIGLSLWMYGLAIIVSLCAAVIIRLVVWSIQSMPQPKAAPPRVPVLQAAPADSQGIPAAHIPVIAAAAAAMFRRPRIIHIQDAGRGLTWLTEGRMVHMTSHRIRRAPSKR